MKKADIGLVGLAVMGENLMLNMAGKGFAVACFNRTVSKVDDFVNGRGRGGNFIACHSPAELAAVLEGPRRIMLMVKAGQAVDETIGSLAPHLAPGDILIDGGNSHYLDTVRRAKTLAQAGLLFVGVGVSGGEEGALKGPSLMPGGNPAAWPRVQPIFEAIAARAPDGAPCCAWLGPDGAGHFVKMVHNGIEYGDMQLIAEAYHVMRAGLRLTAPEMQTVFAQWNGGALNSYLIEITAEILARTDPETGRPMVDVILDAAGQKGTGKWTAQAGLDLGVGIPQIAEAVFARCLSAVKDERVAASGLLRGPRRTFRGDRAQALANLHDALYAAKVCSYAQGFQLLRAASREYGWDLRCGEIAAIWRAGCVIRAQFLDRIRAAFDLDPQLANLLLAPCFRQAVSRAQSAWRRSVGAAVGLGLPVPALGAALSYYDAYRSERLPANLLQAQRDYFGAHTYERVDRARGRFFHTDWTGSGGRTAATAYVV